MPKRITAVFGPYRNKGRPTYRLSLGDEDRGRSSLYFRSQEEALEVKAALLVTIEKQRTLSVRGALTSYRDHLLAKIRPQSVATTLARLTDFFGDLDRAVLELTAARCTELYDDLQRRPAPRTGKPVSVDTHRNALSEAKTFLRFCQKQNWLAENPLDGVEGVGRRSHGKAQLRIDEAKRFATKALELAALGEYGAVAALVALLLGFRASEICSRKVRDLDDSGHLLVIDSGKTKAAARRAAVPDVLRQHLVRMATGRDPAELLFGDHPRGWVREWAHKICDQAGLPRVTAHALRGVCSTLAVDGGMAAHAVAEMLGHTSASISERSYIRPGTRRARDQRELADRLLPPEEVRH